MPASSNARYVVTYFGHLMTPAERAAHRHLCAASKLPEGSSDADERESLRPMLRQRDLLSDDPNVLALVRDGFDVFLERTATRILSEHAAEVFLNNCPRCGELTRTPKAKLCLKCGYNWRTVQAAGPSQ